MATYHWGATECLALEEIDLAFRRYRLQPKEAHEAMAGSLRRHGQLSPVVVCQVEGRLMLLDGFKRHAAARVLGGSVDGTHVGGEGQWPRTELAAGDHVLPRSRVARVHRLESAHDR